MPAQAKCRTEGCAGDPAAKGGAGGDCPRCYQWWRRHPNGPAPAAQSDHRGRSERIYVRLSPVVIRAAKRKARALGRDLASWVEGLIVGALEGEK